jgi:hypothetical protein
LQPGAPLRVSAPDGQRRNGCQMIWAGDDVEQPCGESGDGGDHCYRWIAFS